MSFLNTVPTLLVKKDDTFLKGHNMHNLGTNMYTFGSNFHFWRNNILWQFLYRLTVYAVALS